MSKPSNHGSGNIFVHANHLELARNLHPNLLSLVCLRLAPSEFVQSLHTSKVGCEVSVNACSIGVKRLNDRRPRPVPYSHLAAALFSQLEGIDAANRHQFAVITPNILQRF